MSKNISLSEFKEKMNVLVGKKLSHMDPYYQKIDLHFGGYSESNDLESGDFVLYVSGVWSVINAGKSILNESSEQLEIVEFFHSHLGSIVSAIDIHDFPKQVDIEFSADFILRVTADDDSHWVELLKRNGNLLTYKQDEIVFKQN